ncbi:SDR family NAD(P)-dependent oxidoreductase [Chloroflexota bacterium]
MRFKDKVVIVAGGARDIGQAISYGFGREGAVVVILDKLDEEGRSTAKTIESQGGKALAMKVEATDGQQVKDAVDKIAKEWNRIDVLINNIGWNERMPFLESDESLWRKVLDVNLLVPLRLCRAVLPYMVKQQYGSVVNISSGGAKEPVPWAVAYCAAKAGIISMTWSLATAMIPHNIRVNCVLPGSVETATFKSVRRETPDWMENVLKTVPIGRLSQPEEIAAAVLFLASDEASYIVGDTISVTGGRIMR